MTIRDHLKEKGFKWPNKRARSTQGDWTKRAVEDVESTGYNKALKDLEPILDIELPKSPPSITNQDIAKIAFEHYENNKMRNP